MSSHRTGVKCGRSVMLTMMLTGLAMLLKSICVVALYEDQASLWDWKQSYVGKVQFVWPSQQNGHHQLVIATESSVIAALNIRNGTLSWRKSMEITNGLQAVTHLSHANTQPSGELLTVTSNGRYIRSWNVHKGFLNWERRLPVELIELESQQEAKWLFQADSASSRLAIARFTQSEQNDVQLQSYTFDYLHDTLTAAAQHVTFKLMDWTSFERKCKFVSLQAIACLSNDRIQVIWLNSGRVLSIDFVQFGLTLMEEVPPLRIVAFNEQPFADSILFGLSNGYEVFYVLNVNSNQLLSYQTLFNTESATVQKMGDKHVLFAVTHEVKGAPNEFHVKTYIWKNDKDWAPNHDLDATFVVKNVRQDILVESLFVIPLKKTAGRLAYKIAFTSPDAQFVLPTSKNSTLGWVREESLSCVLAADIVDLPLSDLDENIESALESAESDLISQFLKRLHLQVSQFQLYLKALTQPSTIKTIANSETLQFGYAKQERTSSVLMRDQFGLHKAIVMLTKYGKLIALDTISGKIIWTLYDAQLADSLHKQLQQDKAVHDIRQARKVTLFIQRTTSHHPFQAVCTILLQNGYLFSFDPITGRKLDTTQLPSRPKQIMMLSHVNKDNLKGILILDQENHVQTYPDYVYNDVFLAVKEKYFMMVVQSSTGLVQGFSFDKCDHQQRRASPVWSFTIPISKPTANKLSVHFKPQFEQVHSLGRVLGIIAFLVA